MQYLHMFTQNNHFFKPQRLVWQNSGLENSNVSKTSEETEDISWDEAVEAVNFKNSAKKLCDDGEQNICALAEESDINKTVKLKTFIDELGEKFLNKIPEHKYKIAKNSVKRFQLLQEVADMEAIMERFKEAESYEIKPYNRGKNPAMIIFNYSPDEENPEGTTEEYPLEMSFQKKRDVIEKGAKALKESAEKAEKLRKKVLSKQFKDYLGSTIDLYSKATGGWGYTEKMKAKEGHEWEEKLEEEK